MICITINADCVEFVDRVFNYYHKIRIIIGYFYNLYIFNKKHRLIERSACFWMLTIIVNDNLKRIKYLIIDFIIVHKFWNKLYTLNIETLKICKYTNTLHLFIKIS